MEEGKVEAGFRLRSQAQRTVQQTGNMGKAGPDGQAQPARGGED